MDRVFWPLPPWSAGEQPKTFFLPASYLSLLFGREHCVQQILPELFDLFLNCIYRRPIFQSQGPLQAFQPPQGFTQLDLRLLQAVVALDGCISRQLSVLQNILDRGLCLLVVTLRELLVCRAYQILRQFGAELGLMASLGMIRFVLEAFKTALRRQSGKRQQENSRNDKILTHVLVR